MVGRLRIRHAGLFDCDGKKIAGSVDVVTGVGTCELYYFHLFDGGAL
jgi:hypothetical protein